MKGIRFRPEQKGLRAALFDLEADIMEVVWQQGQGAFVVADILRALARDRDIAYTTVMTTVARLHDKGLLTRVREGKRYVYQPSMSREQFTESMARELMGSLSELGQAQMLSLLVDRVSGSDAEELGKLEVLIRKRKKELLG